MGSPVQMMESSSDVGVTLHDHNDVQSLVMGRELTAWVNGRYYHVYVEPLLLGVDKGDGHVGGFSFSPQHDVRSALHGPRRHLVAEVKGRGEEVRP